MKRNIKEIEYKRKENSFTVWFKNKLKRKYK